MNTLKLFFQVHLTERIVFPITANFGNSNSLVLHQALALTDLPVIQYLGFFDLKNLAEKNQSRREELFTLSQPGGHPYNWNAIVIECLKLVKTFTEDLNKANSDVQPAMESKKEYFPMSNIATSPNTLNMSGMRNLRLRSPASPNASILQTPNMLHAQSGNVNIQAPREPLIKILRLHWAQFIDLLCKKPVICFIFGEIPDAKVRYHLAQAQPVIWAVQGLARLSAASFKEDSYGVVQKDLPEIITALLQLKLALDKLQKIGNYKKSQKMDDFELKMKSALRSAVKRSLYCICIEFGDYVKELKLSKDVHQQLQPYLLFREG
ncbi:hypothetical protein L9F63_018983 [Diploptera punctata]|uniref:Nucleoporin NDC1 n=1 Tax=Diploptera punctata TaxID=6984 RepID=A0AAD7ZVS5_DIPPU|nr:hypothetical protein L9F63_018983 [Diploptera punctata]